MKVYIRPQAFRVLSFDLDDTLYDNRPILVEAERALLEYLNCHYPKSQAWQSHDWRSLKASIIDREPHLGHDTTAARLTALNQGLRRLGYSDAQAKQGAREGLACFLHHRSDFRVSDSVMRLLRLLAQRYRLIGITNGNVDARRVGLGELFEFVSHPGDGVRKKPHGDMFVQACQRLNIEPSHLLHVGDSLRTDIQGARQAGCQAVWLNPEFGRSEKAQLSECLPQIALGSLFELTWLLV